jgi:multiple sugar transport system permease protein
MTTTPAAPALGRQAQRELNRRERNRTIRGLLFASPFWLGFLLLTAVPMLASIYFSFTNYSILSVPKWAGLKNYLELPQDPILLKTLITTVAYAGLSVPLSVGLGLVVALLLNQKVKGVAAWRTIYYLPSITPVVAYAVLWRWMLSRDYGVINAILGLVHIAPIDWLGNEFWIIIAFVMTGLWSIGGTMIINLAGLQSIPTDLQDAAKVDGAGPFSVFRHVTLPMMTPVLFYNVIIGIVGAMQSFVFFYTLTQGNGNTSYTEIGAVYMIYLYRVAFELYRMGYGSAMAWLLFVIIMALTLLVVRTSRRWVYYEGDWLTGR